jgi:chaperone BCS1
MGIDIHNMVQQSIPYLKDALLNNQFLEGGFILGAIAVIGNWLKGAAFFAWERLSRKITFSVTIQEGSYTFNAVSWMIATQHADRPRNVEMRSRMSDSGRRSEYVLKDDLFLIWEGWLPIMVQAATRELEGNVSGDPHYKTVILTTWFFKKRLHSILEVACDSWGEHCDSEEKSSIFTSSSSRGWCYVGRVPNRSVSSVIGPEVEGIATDLQEFLESRDWYESRGIPYKRGYLMHGPPGNGKTSLCKALASEMGLDLCILNLADLTDENASELMADLVDIGRQNQPKLLVAEDVDSFVEGRKVKKKTLSFSTLLNMFDGVASQEGTVLVLTTNIVESLDPALIRPGRIDLKVEVPNPSPKNIQEYLELFYGKKVGNIEFSGVSMSQVQECCIQNKLDSSACKQQLKQLCNEALPSQTLIK